MKRAATALLLFAACAEKKPIELDQAGKMMLDPIRTEALAVPSLIDRLHLAPNAVVADVGAGPGFLTLSLARAVKDGTVIATDVRGDYLAVLEQRAREAGVHNVKTKVVPADQPALDPASIDLAMLCQVDHYFSDRTAYLRALIPALRPGGRIVIVNYARYKDADLQAAEEVSLAKIDEWAPSPPFFFLLLEPKPAAKTPETP